MHEGEVLSHQGGELFFQGTEVHYGGLPPFSALGSSFITTRADRPKLENALHTIWGTLPVFALNHGLLPLLVPASKNSRTSSSITLVYTIFTTPNNSIPTAPTSSLDAPVPHLSLVAAWKSSKSGRLAAIHFLILTSLSLRWIVEIEISGTTVVCDSAWVCVGHLLTLRIKALLLLTIDSRNLRRGSVFPSCQMFSLFTVYQQVDMGTRQICHLTKSHLLLANHRP